MTLPETRNERRYSNWPCQASKKFEEFQKVCWHRYRTATEEERNALKHQMNGEYQHHGWILCSSDAVESLGFLSYI
jgi:hypothetical protein